MVYNDGAVMEYGSSHWKEGKKIGRDEPAEA